MADARQSCDGGGAQRNLLEVGVEQRHGGDAVARQGDAETRGCVNSTDRR
jgi:hypothetical protein